LLILLATHHGIFSLERCRQLEAGRWTDAF
jgi:hypothetical protein